MKVLRKIVDYLRVSDGWVHVRGFANSPIIRLTILMPVFGYTILFNENLTKYFELSKQLVDNSVISLILKEDPETDSDKLTKPTIFRLYSFYFGLSFIGIGSFIYALRCPHTVKKYDSTSSMISEYINTADTLTLRYYFDKVIKHSDKYDHHYKLGIEERLQDAVNNYYNDSDDKKLRISTKEIFRDVWTLDNFTNQISLNFASLFFKLGFLILAIPTLELFLSVIFTLI